MAKAKLVRRTTGTLCLLGALAMLAFGETKPTTGGSHLMFAIYWLACFGLAVGAMILAVLDLFAVRSEARQAQRNLFEETLVRIQNEQGKRPSPVDPRADLKD